MNHRPHSCIRILIIMPIKPQRSIRERMRARTVQPL
jgi:hypothetical protein